MIIGAFVVAAGVLFTTMSYSSSSAGGSFSIYHGALLVGAVEFIYGLFVYLNQSWK